MHISAFMMGDFVILSVVFKTMLPITKKKRKKKIVSTHFPIFGLMNTLCIGFGKFTLRVHGRDGCTELRHGVQLAGKVVQHRNDMVGDLSPLVPFLKRKTGLEY